MAIDVDAVRTDAMRQRHRKLNGFHPDNGCELCRKVIKAGREMLVAMDHETYQFVTAQEAQERGDAVSGFPVGADCYRRIQRALAAT
jgi:hypothetical protein